MLVRNFIAVALVVLLQACGGGGGGSETPASAPMVVSSIGSSSIVSSSSSSSVSSWASYSSMPADFPSGTAETLPVLSLTTENSAAIASRDTYVKGGFALASAGVTDSSGTLEVRGRGNSTWDWPKKPYRLKLTNSSSLLGMPKGKNWVLLANYADKTMMRNDIAFMFSRSLGFEWTPRAQYVELNLNGSYQGVYQLAEHIRIDKDRVNIDELKVTDIDSDKITGGYLMEVDFRLHKDFCIGNTRDPQCVSNVNTQRDIDFCLDSAHGMAPACLANPETLHDPAWANQRSYIEHYYADAEAALFGGNFADLNTGYAAYFDVDSVVNYYIENELFKNVDGAASSFFLYKKRGGKLFMGPVWDFDLSMGNAGYDGVGIASGWHIRNTDDSIWFTQFFKDPAFQAKVKARWKAIKDEGKLEYVFQYAQARAIWLDAQQKKNYSLWSITDVASWVMHGTHGGTGSYEAEVKELIRWQRERAVWIDAQLSQ